MEQRPNPPATKRRRSAGIGVDSAGHICSCGHFVPCKASACRSWHKVQRVLVVSCGSKPAPTESIFRPDDDRSSTRTEGRHPGLEPYLRGGKDSEKTRLPPINPLVGAIHSVVHYAKPGRRPGAIVDQIVARSVVRLSDTSLTYQYDVPGRPSQLPRVRTGAVRGVAHAMSSTGSTKHVITGLGLVRHGVGGIRAVRSGTVLQWQRIGMPNAPGQAMHQSTCHVN